MTPPSRRIKCAIVGNSNSIVHLSYADILSRNKDLEVFNYSIGGCPNALIMHFIANVRKTDFDYIILETSVIDCDMGFSGYISKGEIRNNIEICLKALSEYFSAKILILILPIRIGVIKSEYRWIDEIYIEEALKFGAYVLNTYEMIEHADEKIWPGIPPNAFDAARRVLEEFGINSALTPTFLWTPAFTTRMGLSPFVRHMFADDLHISNLFHDVLANLLSRWLVLSSSSPDAIKSAGIYPDDGPLLVSNPTGEGELITRTSRLITQTFLPINESGRVNYVAPDGYQASALLVNRSATSGILWIEGSAGRFEIDLRFGAEAREFTALIVPIPDDVGNGPFSVGIKSGEGKHQVGRRFWHTDTACLDSHAEVASLTITKRQYGCHRATEHDGRQSQIINQYPWFIRAFQDFSGQFGLGMQSVEKDFSVGAPRVLHHAIELLPHDRNSLVSQARLHMAVGNLDAALAKITTAQAMNPDEPALNLMAENLQKFILAFAR